MINPDIRTKGELIDTLWNVNKAFVAHRKAFDTELIDTLWNVNFVAKLKRPSLLAN